jgi:nitroimidazol reductase NimA-like FMN-containing flavoprotein (pyridoxamine 5'-phosphate oxidase superfamily)
MIEVKELTDDEIIKLLKRTGYGHLACARDGEPYVVPIHFAFDNGEVFVYTTEGKKYEIIKSNPRVCLQAEEVIDNQHWQSVIIDGEAEQILDEKERERAMKLIVAINPSLTPAVSVRWLDSWVRENIEVLYRIYPKQMSGRRSFVGSLDAAALVPGSNRGQVN